MKIFLFGAMVALTPSLIVVAWMLRHSRIAELAGFAEPLELSQSFVRDRDRDLGSSKN